MFLHLTYLKSWGPLGMPVSQDADALPNEYRLGDYHNLVYPLDAQCSGVLMIQMPELRGNLGHGANVRGP